MGGDFPSLKRAAPPPGMGDAASGNASSKSKRSKKPPPLVVPPGHVAFRMLCHVSRIGGVIGKSGFVIKQLQQSTGAKIRVEEAPHDSPDRVVTVIGPPALTSRVLLDRNEEVEASKAQEALLKVFERILEVAAESQGAGIGVVSCRLLVDVAQVGSVIGKGGNVVEKIRRDCGCKIWVLSDNLPACAAPSDEVIEIEGDVLAIKKALLSVSHRLQDGLPSDKIRTVASRPAEAVIHETLPDLHMDHILRRNSILPILPRSSSVFASGVHSSSIDSDVLLSTVDAEVTQQEVVYKILCTNDRIGGVIGKGGTIVRALQDESGATVSVGPSVAGCDERLITISASENIESRYSPAQKAVVLVFSRSEDVAMEMGQDMNSNKGSSVVARLVVPSNQVGCLLGKGGAIISEIRNVTGTNIRIISSDQLPNCAAENDEIVQISGEFSNVQNALYNVTGRLRDNLFSSVLSNSGARNGAGSSTYTESPYGRLRDPAPLVRTTPAGTSYSSFIQHTTTRSTDDLGFSRSLDSPSSPGLWSLQSYSGLSSRAMSDAGRGFSSYRGGVQLGSGSKTAIVTNTTIEIVVPEDVISLVYGENGTNLARLREISGARVSVYDPDPVTGNRLIVVSGTPDETQAAQSLIHAFILTGSS